MSLDHGVLNVPLAKRGHFHRELDAHLLAEAMRKKRAFEEAKFLHGEARVKALSLFALIDEDLLLHHASKRGMTTKALQTLLHELCCDKPSTALKVLKIFIRAD